jgi:UMF1 family MFS transporter
VRDPYVILITIYIFVPWFVRAVVGDPVQGQALVAQGGKWGGWAVMLSMPLLGATIDRLGPRKPLLAPVVRETCRSARGILLLSPWLLRPA